MGSSLFTLLNNNVEVDGNVNLSIGYFQNLEPSDYMVRVTDEAFNITFSDILTVN